MIECAVRFSTFNSKLDRLAEILDNRGLVTDILKNVLHIGNMHYLHFLSIMDPGDVVIVYKNDSSIKISITTLVDHATFSFGVVDPKVKSGHMLWSLLRIIAKQEKNSISATLYMKTYDRHHDKYNLFTMSVCGNYTFKKFF